MSPKGSSASALVSELSQLNSKKHFISALRALFLFSSNSHQPCINARDALRAFLTPVVKRFQRIFLFYLFKPFEEKYSEATSKTATFYTFVWPELLFWDDCSLEEPCLAGGNRSPLSHLPGDSAEVPAVTQPNIPKGQFRDSEVIVGKIPNSGEVINGEVAVPPGKH